MDPDANLAEQLKLAESLRTSLAHGHYVNLAEYEIDVNRLCELVAALDRWVRSFGGPPKRWALPGHFPEAEKRLTAEDVLAAVKVLALQARDGAPDDPACNRLYRALHRVVQGELTSRMAEEL